MATPVILYRNIFRTPGAVVTNSGTETGDFNQSYIYDHRAFLYWKGNVLTSPQWIEVDTGSTGTADSILLVNHNMVANGGQVTVKYGAAPNPGSSAHAAYYPTSGNVDYKAFGSQTARYWRVELSDPAPPFAAKPFIGEIVLGLKLDVGQYVGPDIDPRLHDIEGSSVKSRG